MKLLRNLGYLKTRSDLKSSSSTLNKHERCKNTKSTKNKAPTISQFCPCCVEFLQGACLLNTRVERSRSNFVSKNLIILFSECSISGEFE